MSFFDRQIRIAGWNQERLARACVAVYGRDWLGAFVVWALASLGVGNVLWFGRPSRAAGALARWLLARPAPFPDCRLSDYPFGLEYGVELNWTLGEALPALLVICTESAGEQALSRAFAEGRRIRWLAGTAARGGAFGATALPAVQHAWKQEPITALAVAAVLADAGRQVLCPLPGDALGADGALGWRVPPPTAGCRAVLVGVGAIGTYLATVLAARRQEVHLVDDDRVEPSNLNRQGLFTPADAEAGAHKAVAARRALAGLFPRARLSAEVRRVGPDYRDTLAGMMPGTMLLSAVDNAQTRLHLQDLGRALGWPVIQGGTSTHAADCFVQVPGGRLLDAQMHGALTKARAEEARRDQGSCAISAALVVPGMMAAAQMALRHAQLLAGQRQALAPLRWRSGNLPVSEESTHGLDVIELPDEAGS